MTQHCVSITNYWHAIYILSARDSIGNPPFVELVSDTIIALLLLSFWPWVDQHDFGKYQKENGWVSHLDKSRYTASPSHHTYNHRKFEEIVRGKVARKRKNLVHQLWWSFKINPLLMKRRERRKKIRKRSFIFDTANKKGSTTRYCSSFIDLIGFRIISEPFFY